MNIVPPNNAKKVLLHTCCAVCAGGMFERLIENGVGVTAFYCNPNIFPQAEYEKRKEESRLFCEKKGVPFIECEYDYAKWKDTILGLEDEPERGKRCEKCFDMRMELTADYAKNNRFKVFATSLGISRFKDLEQINKCGKKAASKYAGLIFWDYNWRKKGGQEKMHEVAKNESFYRQNYCGCEYSLPKSGIR